MSEDVVCEREFQILLGEEVKPFAVRWMKPVSDPQGDWSCISRVEWPHKAHVTGKTFGVDSVQALYLAMTRVAAELYAAEPPVFWFEPDDVLGLPVSPTIADLEAARSKGRI